MRITYQVSTKNDGRWGPETSDEAAALCARNLAALGEAYAERLWPEAVLDFGTTREEDDFRTAYQNGEAEPDDTWHPAAAVREYLSRHWCEEPLWERAFDADAYLSTHPR